MKKYTYTVQNDSADLERMMAYMQIQQWMQEMKYNKGDYDELRNLFKSTVISVNSCFCCLWWYR